MKKFFIGLAITLGLTALITSPALAQGVDILGDPCKIDPSSELCKAEAKDAEAAVGNIMSAIFFIVGIIAVIVIVIAGIMFMTSTGDPAKAAKARMAIIYAVIGLVVSITAYAMVQWVVNRMS